MGGVESKLKSNEMAYIKWWAIKSQDYVRYRLIIIS